MGFTDYRDCGIFPLQDHDPGVAVGRRQQMAGGRIVRMTDATQSTDPSTLMIEYGRENDLGTIGDLHPWMFWQTATRGRRATGSWSQAFAAVTVDPIGGSGPVTPGAGGASVLPIKTADYQSDERYAGRPAVMPACLSQPVKGSLAVIMAGVDETKQNPLMLQADGRLWAPSVSGPKQCGTIVCDLQPDREACMDGASEPGVGGRHALLQSLVRVVAMPPAGGDLGQHNGLALNFSLAEQGGIAGYGMVWTKLAGGGPTTGGGPTGPVTPGAGVINVDGVGEHEGKRPDEFGRFQVRRGAGHGVALMAQLGASGPLCGGHEDDKHRIGYDRDGNPINAGHISVDAYFYRDHGKDGPLLFEGDYPYPPNLPLQGRVHLSWDSQPTHLFVGGGRDGVWRWWCEVPYIVPPSSGRPGYPNIPGGPTTPGRPGGPRPSGPTTPGAPGRPRGPVTPGAPAGPGVPQGPTTGNPHWSLPVPPAPVPSGPTTPGGSRPLPPGPRVPPVGGGDPPGGAGGDSPGGDPTRVGGISSADRALFCIHHPFMESWSALAFRPQLWSEGAPSWEHHQDAPADEMRADEPTRPQVLAMRSWGAQSGGAWDYEVRPDQSRARGGTAHGGVFYCPPEFEAEDYVLATDLDVDEPTTQSYVMVAPGVGFALGLPNLDGGLEAGSVTIGQELVGDDPDRTWNVSQLDSARAAKVLFSGRVDQSSGEVVVECGTGGTQAVRIPLGTTAQRPSTLAPSGGELRINASGSIDVLEFWCSQESRWQQILPDAALGSIMVRTAVGWEALEPGDDGDVLTLSGGVPVWAAP